MPIHVALNHRTTYDYDRPVTLSPQVVRLRPAPHCRTKILSYSCRVVPKQHFVNWQQDPQGNYLARLVFPEKVERFHLEVDVVAEMSVINPFDFFLEPDALDFPFRYPRWLANELKPFLDFDAPGPHLSAYLEDVDRTPRKTVDFLVELNGRVQRDIQYLIRMEPGVQTCEDTLRRRSGSCRDSAWLLVQLLRQLGMAARFVSGYLVQLKPDVTSLEGPAGPAHDFTDLHAWAEVYLPGAGWVGLDPTSGLLAGEGHIPLACTPDPYSAAPISGSVDACHTDFHHAMTLERVHEDPRVTKPYREEEWQRIESLGHEVDAKLLESDVRLTMGGEPTFVSTDDMEGAEWRTEALGPEKYRCAINLLHRLKKRFGAGGMLHFGQGKWYPSEPLPRWAMRCYWRKDRHPIWKNEQLVADPDASGSYDAADAKRFARMLADRLRVNPDYAMYAYEDTMYYLWKERRLPHNVDPLDSRLEDAQERERVARLFEQGLTRPVGVVLPLLYCWWATDAGWRSGPWVVRSEELFLVPGDSPIGYRLPLQSLQWTSAPEPNAAYYPYDPSAARAPFPLFQASVTNGRRARKVKWVKQLATAPIGSGSDDDNDRSDETVMLPTRSDEPTNGHSARAPLATSVNGDPLIRTALCVETRGGRLHVFLPPIDRAEYYLELVAAVEQTAEALGTPVILEGYPPPNDPRLIHISVTPDPGVIEVNVPPAESWSDLVSTTNGVYAEARHARLGTEKFDLDGSHTGTGGGNHVVLGGATPSDSPFLRRPDLLRSLIGYWHNHPSLSYLFSGKFVGPTSQAPRVDEGRQDSIYELRIAMEQIPDGESVPPWLVDRVFRHLLVDVTGNTHRAEFCIDKLYSPDSAAGRLGLVEFRGFEMPPHPQMSLTQQLLIRALVARFWDQPYREQLVDWGTALHDRFLLPFFVARDFEDVIDETRAAGIALEQSWFATHFEFRFPLLGQFATRGLQFELRQAIEPWYVLGEEPGAGGTARFVDSSVERLQVLVRGMTESRHVVTCGGRQVPLHPTGTAGEFVAGVRYRAWQPPHCLHPTIPVDAPLVFDLFDRWLQRSLGGCQYHVAHPGGLSHERFPVNAFEAESRRACRFFAFGHTPGKWVVPTTEVNREFPLTLDLRRGRSRQG